MSVISIVYTDSSRTTVKTEYSNGVISFGPYPSNDGPTREAQEIFISNGGSVTEYIPPLPTPVTQVTAYQAKMALLNNNLYSTVETYVNTSTDMALKIAWNNATTFDRASHFITSIGTELGLTESQVDGLFLQASQIT